MQIKRLFIFVIVISQFVFANGVSIIPTPQILKLSGGVFQLSNYVDLEYTGDPSKLIFGEKILSEALAGVPDAKLNTMSVFLDKQVDFNIDGLSPEQVSEAYALNISEEKILITSGSEKGLYSTV